MLKRGMWGRKGEGGEREKKREGEEMLVVTVVVVVGFLDVCTEAYVGGL